MGITELSPEVAILDQVERKLDARIKHEVAKVTEKQNELQVQQTQALTTLAEGVKAIAEFVRGGGLAEVLSGYARSNAVQAILGGLASHGGRNSLDARVLKQNAVEITKAIEQVFDKYADELQAKNSGEERDPEIKDPEGDVKSWLDKRMGKTDEASDT